MSGEQVRLHSSGSAEIIVHSSFLSPDLQFGTQFQTVGPAREKARVPKVLRWTRGTDNDVWQIADGDDRELWKLAHSSRQDMLEPDAGDFHPSIHLYLFERAGLGLGLGLSIIGL